MLFRSSSREKIHAVAQGRVWTGLQARERGLVDELGGLEQAVAIARRRANIPDGEDVELVAFPPRRSFYEALAEQLGGGSVASRLMARFGGLEGRGLAAAAAPVTLFRRGEPLALMPFTFVR